MATVRQLRIRKFRNVRPGTQIEIHPGVNVLLDRNGTGKTTLLQWLADALSDNMEPWARDAYDIDIELSAQAGEISVRLKNEPASRRDHLQQRIRWSSSELAELQAEPEHGAAFEMEIVIVTPGNRYEIYANPTTLTFRQPGTAPLEIPGARLRTASIVEWSAFLKYLWAHTAVRVKAGPSSSTKKPV